MVAWREELRVVRLEISALAAVSWVVQSAS